MATQAAARSARQPSAGDITPPGAGTAAGPGRTGDRPHGFPGGTGLQGDDGTAAGKPGSAAEPPGSDLVDDDLLVEEVSIDGMCGVY